MGSLLNLAQQIIELKQAHGLKLFKSGRCDGDAGKCAELAELVQQWEGVK